MPEMTTLRCFVRIMLVATIAILAPCNTAVSQLIVAHRGASDDAPENTLSAFRLAWEQDADAIEGDFYLTKDSHIVAIHDKSTERTGGVDRDVRDALLSELKSLDVGSWKDKRFAGERIPTLEEVCRIIPPKKTLVLEIKDSPRIVPVLVEQIESVRGIRELCPDRLIIIAFDADVIAACNKAVPDVKALWLTSFRTDENTGEITPTIDTILRTLKRTGADGLDCKAADHIDQQFVRSLRDEGYEFHVWTIDDPAIAKRFQDLGADSITTNRPAVIRKALQLERAAVP